MSIFDELSEYIQAGHMKKVKELVQQALDQGEKAADILDKGLLDGMNIIGEKFKTNDVFVPEVLLTARAMNAGIAILKPYLVEAGVASKGKAVLGTVRGDLHDIGKNLVKIMFEGKGIEVIDLGVDVPAERFIEAAQENGAQIICCSALLTTTMNEMKRVVELCEEKHLRDQMKIMIGGAPVNQAYCDAIHADCYTPDAASASDMALKYCSALA